MFSHKRIVLGCLFGLACVVCATANAGGDKGDKPLHKDALDRTGAIQFRGGDGFLSLAYSPDGKRLASGGRNDPVRIWDLQTGQLIRTLPDTWVWALAFSPDGNTLATGGSNKTIRLWDLQSGKELRQLKGHTATVKSVAFSADGATLASGSDDATVRAWKVADGVEIANHKGHGFGVNAVAFADDKTVVSGSTDRTIRVWGDKPQTINVPSGITGVAVLADKKTAITAGDDGVLRVWDLATGKQAREWKGHADGVSHLSVSRDGKTLASTGGDKQIKLWNADNGTATKTIARATGDGDALALAGDASQVAAAGANGAIRRWDANGAPVGAAPLPEGVVTSVAFAPRGNGKAVAYTTNQVVLFDAAGKPQHRLVCGPDDGEAILAYIGDGKTLVTGGGAGPLVIWDVASGKEIKKLTLPKNDVALCLAASPDGKLLAVGYANGGVRVWDVAGGNVAKEIAIPRGARAVAISQDSKHLAVGTEDSIAIYDLASYALERQYGKLNDTVACLAFAPDGRTLAAGMFANAIRLFDLTMPKDKKDIEPRALEGHQGVVNSLAWSPNGRCLASGGFDKTVRLWEFVNGQPIAVWTGHLGEVTSVAFHPNARQVLSGSRDTTALAWDATCLGQGGKLPTELPYDDKTLDGIWKELAMDNNPVGNKAMWQLAAVKDHAKYLGNKVFLADPNKIKQYIRDLDSDNFRDREKATKALASYERWIEGVLKSTLENPPSEEVRQRVEKLLLRLISKDAITLQQERLRLRRAIEAIEQANTPAGRELLQKLAEGAAEEDLRLMAAGAVVRLSAQKQ